jgi:hypothetical protein
MSRSENNAYRGFWIDSSNLRAARGMLALAYKPLGKKHYWEFQVGGKRALPVWRYPASPQDVKQAIDGWFYDIGSELDKKGLAAVEKARKLRKQEQPSTSPLRTRTTRQRRSGRTFSAIRKNPSVGDYFHAAKRSASAAVRDVAAKAAAAAHAEAKRERKVTPEQALQALAKSLGFTVVRGNPQKELRRYAVYRLGAHPAERPLWTGNATSGRHAQIQAERATGKDVGEARLVQGGSSLLRKNSK